MTLVDPHGRPLATPKPSRPIQARYDAASSGLDNARHWAEADSLSATAANSSHVRRRLRDRSRYEAANNSYLRGILNTLSAYTIGSGPTLQLTHRGGTSPDGLREAAAEVEHAFAVWSYTRKLASKLFTLQLALDQDGESFALLTTSRRPSMHTPITLDLRLYECDHFESVAGAWQDDAGVKIDANGEPTEYAFTPDHPGDAYSMTPSTWIDAADVIHLFRTERPGQLRGIPKTTPALPLFAQLRRFTLATIQAAEVAACFSAVLSPPIDDDGVDICEPWENLPITRGMMTTIPAGARLEQFKSENPNAQYDEFVRSILREIARCLAIPAVLALGDASGYNYSSGRLDMQSFNRQMEIDRAILIERDCLDRILESWLDEALLVDQFLPEIFRQHAHEFEWGWRWQSPGHVDRQKEANGQAAELAANTTTLAREYARQGLDWETELRQRARELAVMRELGLTSEVATVATPEDSTDSQFD